MDYIVHCNNPIVIIIIIMECPGMLAIGWITIKVPKWGQNSYEMYNKIWYEIVTHVLRDICAKFKSTTLSAYRDIHI